MSEFNNTGDNLARIPSSLQSLVIVQVTFYSVITVVGTIANLALCSALLRTKHPRKASAYFIFNLALADLMTCSLGIPLDIVVILMEHWPLGAFMCKVVYPFQTLLTAVSVVTLTCMAVERYRAMVTPFKPMFSVRIVKIAIITVWCLSAILVSPYVAILKYRGLSCQEAWQGDKLPKIFTLCVFLLFYAVPLSVIGPTYALIGVKLHSEGRIMRNFSRRQGQGNQQFRALVRQRTKSKVVIVRTFLFGAIAFAVCLLPYHVMWLWHDFGEGNQWTHFSDALIFANALVYFNSLVDPFIFGGTVVLEWRKHCTAMLCKCLNLVNCKAGSKQRTVKIKTRKETGDRVMLMQQQVSLVDSPRQQRDKHLVSTV